MIKFASIHLVSNTYAANIFISPLAECFGSPSLIIYPKPFIANSKFVNINRKGHVVILAISIPSCSPGGQIFKSLYISFFVLVLIARGYFNKTAIFIVHMTIFAFISLPLLRLFTNHRLVYFNHGFSFLGYPKYSLVWLILLSLDWINCSLAKIAVTVSPTQLEIISSHYGFSRNSLISTQPGSCAGLNNSFYLPKTQVLAKVNKISTDFPIKVLYVGRPVKRKGYHVAISAVLNANKILGMNAFQLTMLGVNNNDLLELGYSSESMPFPVNPCGSISSVKSYYQENHILILPSLHEGFGYAYLEAAANAMALILYDIPGPDQIAKHQFNAFRLRLDSTSFDFATSLITFFHDRKLLARFMLASYDQSLFFDRKLILNALRRDIGRL